MSMLWDEFGQEAQNAPAKLVKNRQLFNNWSIAMRNYIQIRFYELLKDVISSQQTEQDYPHENMFSKRNKSNEVNRHEKRSI